MYMSDIMTTNVFTISSKTSLAEARKIMEVHHLRRLPVVDRGMLVGIVTRDQLDRVDLPQISSFDMHEFTRILNKVTVKEVMTKDPITISPDATVEEGVTLAQEEKIGALLVVDDGKLVGIATTNDSFYKILNPILGIGKAGSRLIVKNCAGIKQIEKIIATINKLGLEVETMFMLPIPERDQHNFVIHLTSEDPTPLMAELRKLGYKVERRAR
jgi:acetoin utilization protein AcuB